MVLKMLCFVLIIAYHRWALGRRNHLLFEVKTNLLEEVACIPQREMCGGGIEMATHAASPWLFLCFSRKVTNKKFKECHKNKAKQQQTEQVFHISIFNEKVSMHVYIASMKVFNKNLVLFKLLFSSAQASKRVDFHENPRKWIPLSLSLVKGKSIIFIIVFHYHDDNCLHFQ